MASQSRQAEAERDLSLKRAEYERTVKTAQAQADKAYEIEATVMQQQIVAEQVGVERVQREAADQGAGRGDHPPRARA